MFAVREFLVAVAQELAERGTTSRDLLALQFEEESGDLRVLVGHYPHPVNYPSLEDILGMVCATCEEDGIALSDLERIIFFDTEINLECARLDGEAVYTYPVASCIVH